MRERGEDHGQDSNPCGGADSNTWGGLRSDPACVVPGLPGEPGGAGVRATPLPRGIMTSDH